MEIFQNIINVFTVTFDQFNASMHNKNFSLFFLMVVSVHKTKGN